MSAREEASPTEIHQTAAGPSNRRPEDKTAAPLGAGGAMLSVLTKFLYSITRNFMSHFMSHSNSGELEGKGAKRHKRTKQQQQQQQQQSLKSDIIDTLQNESISQRCNREGTSYSFEILSILGGVIDRRESSGLSKGRGVIKKLGVSINFSDFDDLSQSPDKLTNVVIDSIIPTLVIPISETLDRVISTGYDNTVCPETYYTTFDFDI